MIHSRKTPCNCPGFWIRPVLQDLSSSLTWRFRSWDFFTEIVAVRGCFSFKGIAWNFVGDKTHPWFLTVSPENPPEGELGWRKLEKKMTARIGEGKTLKWNIHRQKLCQNFRNPLELWNQSTIKSQRKSSKEDLNLIAIYDFHIFSECCTCLRRGKPGNNKKRVWNCLGCGTQRHSNVLAECDFQDCLVSVITRHISGARWSCWLLEACPVGNLTPSCTASTFKIHVFLKVIFRALLCRFWKKTNGVQRHDSEIK